MKKLLPLEEVKEKIEKGEKLMLAGDENLLKQLPIGNWIGGTIPYFMGDDGGVFTKEKIFVDEVPDFVSEVKIKCYDENTIPKLSEENFDHGYTVIIIPAFSSIHSSFAENSNEYKDIFNTPLVGWISGIDLTDIGKESPKVFNGLLGSESTDKAVVMHIKLPDNKVPTLDIVNLFEQGDSDVITFPSTGFNAEECFVNGEKNNFAEYLLSKNIDTKLPLVADFYGAMINTSFSKVDEQNKKVDFYAPVFKDVEYKIAKPVENYVESFDRQLSNLNISPEFSCNCILNYLYSELEGKKTSNITGPITFGEIAYQLLNQTMVYLNIENQK